MTNANESIPGEAGWGTTRRDRRNLAGVIAALIAWAVSFVGGAWLIQNAGVTGVPAMGLAVLALLLGILLVLVYARYLRDADEVQRSIQVWGLALGYGGGWLAITGYRLFELLGAPAMSRGALMLVMAGLYLTGVWVGWRRYS